MKKQVRRIFFMIVFFAGISLVSCTSKDKLPNIVVIMVDDMGNGDSLLV